MFKHILVPVDGSPTSMMAVSKAAGLAKAFGSAVTILYVIDPYPFTGVGADFAYGQAQYLSAATAEANAALDAAKKLPDWSAKPAMRLLADRHLRYIGREDTAASADIPVIQVALTIGRVVALRFAVGRIEDVVVGSCHVHRSAFQAEILSPRPRAVRPARRSNSRYLQPD